MLRHIKVENIWIKKEGKKEEKRNERDKKILFINRLVHILCFPGTQRNTSIKENKETLKITVWFNI